MTQERKKTSTQHHNSKAHFLFLFKRFLGFYCKKLDQFDMKNNFTSIFIVIIHEERENHVIVIAFRATQFPKSTHKFPTLVFLLPLARAADNIKYLFIVDDKKLRFSFFALFITKNQHENFLKFQTWQLKIQFSVFFCFSRFPSTQKYFSAALIQMKNKNKKRKSEFYVRKVSRQKHEISHFS